MCAECPSLWMKARLQLTFFCYKPFCFCFFIFLHDLHTKSRKVCQKTRSALPQASVPCKGQRTKHTTAKRPFVACIHHFYIDHNAPCLLHKSLLFFFYCVSFSPGEIEDSGYCKIFGGKQGAYWSMWKWWISSGDISGSCLLSGVALAWIGHFRVPKTLTFKMRLGEQPFLWKWVLFAWVPYQGWEPTLVLKQRPGGTRKWLISRVVHMLLIKALLKPFKTCDIVYC